jgi:hypothetical protein
MVHFTDIPRIPAPMGSMIFRRFEASPQRNSLANASFLQQERGSAHLQALFVLQRRTSPLAVFFSSIARGGIPAPEFRIAARLGRLATGDAGHSGADPLSTSGRPTPLQGAKARRPAIRPPALEDRRFSVKEATTRQDS